MLQDDLRVHQYLLGYASDLNFLPVALQPYGIGFLEKGIQIATIDHSMWFHRPFNINEWLLYNVEYFGIRCPGLCTRRVLYPGWRAGRFYRTGRGNA